MAAFLSLASCGGSDGGGQAPPVTLSNSSGGGSSGGSPPPGNTAQSCPDPGTSTLPVTTCMSDAGRQRIRGLLLSAIADGTIMQLHGGFDPRHYPGEVIATAMGVAEDTGDGALMAWAQAEILRVRDRIAASQGVLIWPQQIDGAPTFGELAQARLVLSMALIYRATRNDAARETAVNAFNALQRFPRLPVRSSITGRTYTLPAYAFHNPANPTAISGRTLDPNHDAVLAAAYAVMATHVLTDPVQAQAAAQEADHFHAAAEDMAHAGRCLPLADDPVYVNACDTRYNGYWGFSLETYAAMRPASSARRTIDVQFAYARAALNAFQTSRTYPAVLNGDYPDPVEPLAFWGALRRNMSATEVGVFVQRTNALIENGPLSDWPRGNLYPKYYQ